MSTDNSASRETVLAQLESEDPMARVEAAWQLARIGSLRGKNALLQALTTGRWEVRVRATHYLGRIGALWSVEPIAVLLEDPETSVRNEAIFALLGIGRPVVVPHLLRALGDEDIERREDARVALVAMLGDEAAEQLGEFVEEEGEAERIRDWWNANAGRFSAGTFYEGGEPVSVSNVVGSLDQVSTAAAEIVLARLEDWTGQTFPGLSVDDQVKRWRAWAASNGAKFESGRRYFGGYRVDEYGHGSKAN